MGKNNGTIRNNGIIIIKIGTPKDESVDPLDLFVSFTSKSLNHKLVFVYHKHICHISIKLYSFSQFTRVVILTHYVVSSKNSLNLWNNSEAKLRSIIQQRTSGKPKLSVTLLTI